MIFIFILRSTITYFILFLTSRRYLYFDFFRLLIFITACHFIIFIFVIMLSFHFFRRCPLIAFDAAIRWLILTLSAPLPLYFY